MHYCSLQHRTWLSPPDTFATEHRFCFGSVASFSLDPLIITLHSPSGILDTLPPGGLIFWCDIFLPFILSMEFSRQEYWSGLPFPSPVDMLSELFSMTSLSLVALTSWLRASLSYAGPFTRTREWSMRGYTYYYWWLTEWRIYLQHERPRFNHWVRKILWRGEWQSTPVFLPGELHGQGSLAGYSPCSSKELGMTERLTAYVKQITNKDLLYSTGNSTQPFIIASKGKDSNKEYIYV